MALPLFFLAFAALWLIVTTLLVAQSGWNALVRRYPDRQETPRLALPMQSGSMGGVNMRGVLFLSACPSGLRVAMLRVFNLFGRPFFVPWGEIKVEHEAAVFGSLARLRLGVPSIGDLSIDARTWERLATAAGASVAATTKPSPLEPVEARVFFLQWVAYTVIGGTFLAIGPRVLTEGASLPLALCYAMPAVVFGLVQIANYLLLRGRR